MIELVAVDGYQTLTVRALARRARVSTGTFYSHYRSIDDCFLSTFDRLCQRASQRLSEAGENEPEPQRCLEAAVGCFLRDMAADPLVATFMFRAAPAAGPAFLGGLRKSAMRFGEALKCHLCGDAPNLHPLLLEGIVAGLAWVARVLVPAAGESGIRGLAAEVAEWIMSFSDPSSQDAELPVTSVPPRRGKGLSVPGRLREGYLGGALGDERAMIQAAAFQVAKGGYHQLSVPQICRAAGVSRRDFNRHFESFQDCFVSALEERATKAIAAEVRDRPASATWRSAVYGALRALCGAIDSDRDGARLLFIDITEAGAQGLESRDRLIVQAADALRTTAPRDRAPSELAAEASTAAAWAILRRGVQDRKSATIAVLPVLSLLLLPPGSANHANGNRARELS